MGNNWVKCTNTRAANVSTAQIYGKQVGQKAQMWGQLKRDNTNNTQLAGQKGSRHANRRMGRRDLLLISPDTLWLVGVFRSILKHFQVFTFT